MLLVMHLLAKWTESSPELAGTAPLISAEAATLLDLRSALGIRSRYWPRRTNPCINWSGILCDQQGHVVSITLTGLKRTVSAAFRPSFALEPLQNLTNLRHFNSSGFLLPGNIPYWFGTLPSIELLDFTNSSINSSIPSSLGNLSNMQILILAHNNLSGNIPSSLGNLHNLTTLDLSSNSFTGPIPLSLSNIPNLQVVNLGFNRLGGEIPVGLGGLSKLQSLILAGNDLQGPIPIELGNLSLLRSLNLGSNFLSGPIPSEIGSLTLLNTLIVSKNSLNETIPPEISNCTNLQVLSLDQNSLTGKLPSSIGLLRNLYSLSLFSNNLTGALPTGFASFVQAKEILLSHNLFYGTVTLVASNLPVISKLDLSNNYFEGTLSEPFFTGALLDENCFSNQTNQRNLVTCKKFYSDIGLTFQGIINSPSMGMQITGNNSAKSHHLGPILGGVFGGLGFVLLIIMLMFFVLKRQGNMGSAQGQSVSASRKGRAQPFTGDISVNILCLGDNFSYAQLQQATAEFNASNLLKAGHSGDLYKGFLEGGLPVVVKRIELGKFKEDGYLAELEFFGKASHTRLVSLLGHCLERDDEKLLVYKYMPCQDLGIALHRRTNGSPSEDSLQSLDWITRLKIAIGVAEGLTYLHNECTPPLVHRDIQASSILLDDKFEVRLGSLTEACVAVGEAHPKGISRILRRQQTLELVEAGGAVPTCAYDVYCFGKVLLELVSGKLGISGSTDPTTEAWLEWAVSYINVHDKESVSKIVDASLIVDEDLMEEVWAMAIVAKSCLNPRPSKRPLMRYILKALENPLKVVREDTLSNSRRSRTSSHGSWNAALFGSWRHSSSETNVLPGSLREEYLQKNAAKATNGGSQSSGHGERSHRRPASSEIFPEPLDDSVYQAPTITNSDRQDI